MGDFVPLRWLPPFAVPALLALACAAPSAAAVEPGVHVDPKSPAAKEYAIPLEQARAAGGSSRARRTSRFGAGIEPGSSAAAAGSSRSRGGERSGGGSSRGSKPRKVRLADARPGVSRPAASTAEDSGSPTLRLVGIALGLVAVAGLIALALRRGLRGGV